MSNRRSIVVPVRPVLAGLILALGLSLPGAGTAQGPGAENGGWRYLGGDAWHTRYTTSSQITASNFEELELAWRFDAASFGRPPRGPPGASSATS